ncbi:MAG: hypothetical protein ATN35_08065 [Epulopiscium sp. Nele67-Bin004]|nr:MAG: hypothetical protein ATN35_08065 [Epulopiscium sp. Nele67-Bin004]
MIEDKGFILFLDFYKAFDSVEHPFILKALEYFGFGHKFIKIIDMLYNDINSSVSLSWGTSKRFEVKRGIRQGCSCSPLLFILVAELLAILIKNSPDIEPLNVLGKNLSIIQLADDSTIFLKSSVQIPLVIKRIEIFSKASGLHLNLKKCELMAIHDHSIIDLYEIPVKKEVKYLGVVITKENKARVDLNIGPSKKKSELILRSWLQRDLSLFGRILITKIESLSRVMYPAFSVAIPDSLIKAINQTNFNFIWRNKHHYLRKGDSVKPLEEGGLNVIDYEVMNGMIKLKWLKHFLQNINGFWFHIPFKIFEVCGGIDFLLRCDFCLSKLPIKLSKFHEQVLLYWKMIFKHNFTPHNSPIWNNRYILVKRKSS